MQAAEFFQGIVRDQKRGIPLGSPRGFSARTPRGIASVCSAHRLVLDAAVRQAAEDGLPLLVESTVNQVNQFGGYTGMKPTDFRAFAETIAGSLGFPADRIIIGGDHLGPYPWRQQGASEAMAKSRELVAASVQAGYAKIHLDTSMPLGGDAVDPHGALDPRVAAQREAELAAAAEEAFGWLSKRASAASPPVYVIGTEVPTPGGTGSSQESVSVTREQDLLQTVELCREAFLARGLSDAWGRVCAVVTQPGVEFGDHEVHAYDRAKAAGLCRAAREKTPLILEGHSTDYQSSECLRQLVEDGVAILKVGPALSFAMRECLFSLEMIERELCSQGRPLSALAETLERAMIANPAHWKSYYPGAGEAARLARKYSLSDRSRYYWAVPEVQAAADRLLSNLREEQIPLTLVSQFLPLQLRRVREGAIPCAVDALLSESVRAVLRDYSAAVR